MRRPLPAAAFPMRLTHGLVLASSLALLLPHTAAGNGPLQPSQADIVESPQIFNSSNSSVSCPKNCTGHGRCLNGWCSCWAGWHGKDCATMDPFHSNCPNRVCHMSYGGSNISVPRSLYYSNSSFATNLTCSNCGGHGYCSVGVCSCVPGYHGPGCEIGPMFCPNDFHCGHGVCNKNGTCDCHTQWAGWNCSEVLWTCPKNCSQRGTCLTTGKCLCYKGSTGEDCALDSFRCPKHFSCNGHGRCEKGKCACAVGWQGFDCSMETPTCPQDFDCGPYGSCVNGGCICHDGFAGEQCLLPFPAAHRKKVQATPTPSPTTAPLIFNTTAPAANSSDNASNETNAIIAPLH